MFRKNKMHKLRVMKVNLNLTDISSARYLLDHLFTPAPPDRVEPPDVVGNLVIRVGLAQDFDYDDQNQDLLNEVTRVMQEMRKFKVYCEAFGRYFFSMELLYRGYIMRGF